MFFNSCNKKLKECEEELVYLKKKNDYYYAKEIYLYNKLFNNLDNFGKVEITKTNTLGYLRFPISEKDKDALEKIVVFIHSDTENALIYDKDELSFEDYRGIGSCMSFYFVIKFSDFVEEYRKRSLLERLNIDYLPHFHITCNFYKKKPLEK